jgi:hypothetical protein
VFSLGVKAAHEFGTVTTGDGMEHSHRCISAWVRLRGSEEALARVVTLYKVGIPVNFE